MLGIFIQCTDTFLKSQDHRMNLLPVPNMNLPKKINTKIFNRMCRTGTDLLGPDVYVTINNPCKSSHNLSVPVCNMLISNY